MSIFYKSLSGGFFCLAATFYCQSVLAEVVEETIEEVIVTSSFIHKSLSEVEDPLYIVRGDELSRAPSQSLGESLGNLLGVSSMDYGAAVGQPIIRGMSGSRVKVLNNGMVVRDVSGLGGDHLNEVDLNDVQQIEVVRGPSSLLYSNGTIGGIINVVDNTIAKTDFTEAKLNFGLEAQSVNDGEAHSFFYQNNLGGFNLIAAYKKSDFGDFDIPDGAVLHNEGHAADEDDEALSYLPNSDFASTAKRFGLSKTGDWGYIGVSHSNIESVYGIPFHGDEHGDEEHGDERIFSTTASSVVSLEGSFVVDSSGLDKIDYYFRGSDYQLTEQHAEEEGGESESAPTLFKNEAVEYGAIFALEEGNFHSQKLAINFAVEDVSVIGDEEFISPTESEEITLGYYLSRDFDLFHLDVGIRHDRISRKGTVVRATETIPVDKQIINNSFALTLGKEISDEFDVSLGFASVERAQSTVELFINGPHLATGRFEVGNENLESEQSNNIDITLSYEKKDFFATLTLYNNEVADYIYLLDETDAEHALHGGDDHEGLISANYRQQDAEFAGYEFELGKTFQVGRGQLSATLGGESVSGDFDDGGNIPRLTPARSLYSLRYDEDGFSLSMNLKHVHGQEDVAANETRTSGFDMLDVGLTKSFSLASDAELNISAFAKNLLDEAARNHSSFVKDEVPLAGRNYGIKLFLSL